MAPRIDLELNDSLLATDESLIVVRNRPIEMGAKDILVPRAGLQWRPRDFLALRLGVRYRPTPLPKADGSANYLDSPATTIAGGVGLVLLDDVHSDRSPLSIDIALAWTGIQRRSVHKIDPSDPVVATSVHGYNIRFAATLHHDF